MDDRIKLYVKGLDEQMEGGMPQNYVVLVCGGTGTLKSSLMFNIIYRAAMHDNRKGLYISLEQSRKSLTSHMAKLGMDLAAVESLVTIMDLGRLRKELGEEILGTTGEELNWMQSLLTQVRSYKQMLGFEILAIDSLNALYALTPMDNPRNELFHFFEAIRGLEVTTLLVSEIPEGSTDYGKYGVESFLSDGILLLTRERKGSAVGRFLQIVKMRETKHPTDYFPLLPTPEGFTVVYR